MEGNGQKIDIKKFLPHRPPMLLVSNMPYIDNTSVITEFIITPQCIFLENDFFTEGGLIENAAQTCSAIVGQSFYDDEDLEGNSNNLIGYISAIKKVEIFALPKVNETLVTKAKLLSRYDLNGVSICTMSSNTFRNDDLIVDCTLNCLIQEV
ncbi:ABC transporter permease [Maribacter cobaltidurans]|uniref:ABC transporter permease n=1 Tax=Maribacter cobaltidurans TaxID=1178778 RepID=A0A223V497_9FLAO|nr:ABC transporter permease [Maribacter cobaltidurans]ASV29818.1 ABC transporter permease [Maribacter cobaltidurans]GGD92228.1 flexirubin biosynthesis protein [Maribacter cobaltidurans]